MRYLPISIQQYIFTFIAPQQCKQFLQHCKPKHLLPVLWMIKNQWKELGTYIPKIAVQYGHIEVFRQACDMKVPIGNDAITSAIICGHLPIIQIAHENGYCFTTWNMTSAAHYGQFHVVKYLHTHCPDRIWTKWVPAFAVLSGSLEIVRYAHENGCEWDEYTLNNAIRYGHDDIVEYYLANS